MQAIRQLSHQPQQQQQQLPQPQQQPSTAVAAAPQTTPCPRSSAAAAATAAPPQPPPPPAADAAGAPEARWVEMFTRPGAYFQPCARCQPSGKDSAVRCRCAARLLATTAYVQRRWLSAGWLGPCWISGQLAAQPGNWHGSDCSQSAPWPCQSLA
jgi:hypothetical protein